MTDRGKGDEKKGAADTGTARVESTFFSRYQKAILVLILVCAVWPWYFGLNALNKEREAANLSIWIDRIIPFQPDWEYVYFFVFLFLFFPVCSVRCDDLFRRVFWAYGFLILLSFVVFLIFPVRCPRPELKVTGFISWGLRLHYFLDEPQNCFPSLHLAIAFISALVVWRIDKPVGGFALILAAVIGYSTMTVKQHFFLDVIAGIALAFLAYFLFIRSYNPGSKPLSSIRRPRWLLLLIFFSYGIVLAGFYVAYLWGWQPWEG